MPHELRVGHGYDVHRLRRGRKLFLGGVEIPHDRGLVGHSDADVLLHALMNALLGAMGRGDIGSHFPDTDPRYKGISSVELLKRVTAWMHQGGFVLVNADVTVIAQAPRLAPFYDAMKKAVAAALQARLDAINIKAATAEKLGSIGQGKAMAAAAVVLLSRRRAATSRRR
jgi:2-C-methyl-D-erythritol 2,4-cyclodiphosphate synthase